eukprot:362713-Chlamydomonas_euryale.AAC.18
MAGACHPKSVLSGECRRDRRVGRTANLPTGRGARPFLGTAQSVGADHHKRAAAATGSALTRSHAEDHVSALHLRSASAAVPRLLVHHAGLAA